MAVIDARQVEEFLNLVRDRVDDAVLDHMGTATAAKSGHLADLLSRPLTVSTVRDALGCVFAARRPLRSLGDDDRLEPLLPALRDLLHGPGPVAARLDGFAGDALDLLGPAATDVATDLLHFARPDEYWLWTRWMWDPAGKSGVLPLLGGSPAGGGASAGEQYLQVGEALAYLRGVLGTRDDPLGKDAFGLDVFLAMVYATYSYMVASVRTTEEFAGILPRPAEMAARLLGIGPWLTDGTAETVAAAEGRTS